MKLLSIVIPTRGREYYCIEAIKDILSYKREDFELVVCDNSDTDQIEDFIKQNPDERVVYQHIHGRINSVLNMDTAMQMATGEYVCMIGDDDTILPNIFEVAEFAKKHNYDNISPLRMVSYFWPSEDGQKGHMHWNANCSNEFVIRNCKEQIAMFVSKGLTTYERFLPRVYHGIIKRAVLVDVYERTGHMIGGLSPDIYMSVSSACVMKSFVQYMAPFTIAGACPKSYTAKDNKQDISWRIEDNPQFYKRGNYVWDSRVPKITASETIWADSAIKAFEELHFENYLTSLNQGYLFAELIKNNTKISKYCLAAILKTKKSESVIRITYNFIKYFITGGFRKYTRKKINKRVCQDVNSIDDSVRVFLKNQ